MKHWKRALVGVAVLGLLGGALWMGSHADPAEAADHTDPPGRTGAGAASPDTAADIADLYAWHNDDGKTVLVLTFAGPADPMADQEGTYDPDVLYRISVDNDDDQTADINIDVRFAENSSGHWGVQLTGIPGGDPVVQAGPVQRTNNISGVTDGFYWAGLRDDPFFFDLEGFGETLSTGDLSFDDERDSFAGRNVTAVVIQLDTADLGAGTFDVWATTARTGG